MEQCFHMFPISAAPYLFLVTSSGLIRWLCLKNDVVNINGIQSNDTNNLCLWVVWCFDWACLTWKHELIQKLVWHTMAYPTFEIWDCLQKNGYNMIQHTVCWSYIMDMHFLIDKTMHEWSQNHVQYRVARVFSAPTFSLSCGILRGYTLCQIVKSSCYCLPHWPPLALGHDWNQWRKILDGSTWMFETDPCSTETAASKLWNLRIAYCRLQGAGA